MFKLDFDLRTGLPIDFDYSGKSWNRLTWRQCKINKFLRIVDYKWRFLKKGKILKFLFGDVNGDFRWGYFQLFYRYYPKNNKWKNARLRLVFDRIYWQDHHTDVKIKFIANLRIYNHCFCLFRG